MIESLEHPFCTRVDGFRIADSVLIFRSLIIAIASATRHGVVTILFKAAADIPRRSIVGSLLLQPCPMFSIAIRCLSGFPGANQPLVQVFTATDAHHLLLQTKVSLRHDRLKLAFAASVAKLVEMARLLDSSRDSVRVRRCSVVFD